MEKWHCFHYGQDCQGPPLVSTQHCQLTFVSHRLPVHERRLRWLQFSLVWKLNSSNYAHYSQKSLLVHFWHMVIPFSCYTISSKSILRATKPNAYLRSLLSAWCSYTPVHLRALDVQILSLVLDAEWTALITWREQLILEDYSDTGLGCGIEIYCCTEAKSNERSTLIITETTTIY